MPAHAMYVFEGVSGPTEVTTVPPPRPTALTQYAKGTRSRLAVLLTDPSSAWLGLAHGLKAIGIPFVITQDYAEALTHQVVLVYPEISGVVLSPEALQALAAFPRSGGTLIGSQVLGGGLQEVFGFRQAIPSRQRFEVRFDPDAPGVSSFTDPSERALRLGDRNKNLKAFGSYGYTQSTGPLAVYEDGTAAVTHKSHGKGQAYAIGIDLGFLLLKGYNNRGEEMTWSYDNRFDPTLDVWLRLLKVIYTAGQPESVTIGTVPFGKGLSVMLTHDVDFTHSMANAVSYAEYEKSQGLVGTYFIQTKYIRDFNDDIFFDNRGIIHLKKLAELGMEIGSHTVAHSKVFSQFPMGTGAEQYPTYTPFVKDRKATSNGTILGELRVSKFLLEYFSDHTLVSFRPGELSNPVALPQALQAAGYRYSSSTTANNSLTHLPYQLNYDRFNGTEVDVFEFPVTVEDEELPKLGDRVPQAVELAHKISRYGGSFVVLIHPNILDHKLEFEKRFVEAVKSFAWFGSVSQFGHWWSARNEVAADVSREGDSYILTLQVPNPMAGLTIQVPGGWTLEEPSASLPSAEQVGQTVTLRDAHGTIVLRFSKTRSTQPST
ncbi:MAG: hypothetical protein H0W13_07580 [Nitrospirales bacterium]|nr:hypothetical protein [Nitrospirales bacterium]